MGVEQKIAVRAIIDTDDLVGLKRAGKGPLILKRAEDTGEGQWCLPGGKTDGKPPREAVVKETKEETDLDFEPEPNPFMVLGPAMESGFRTLYYRGRASGKVRLNEESSNFSYATRERAELLQFAFPGNRVAIIKYLDEKYMGIAIEEARKCRDEDDEIHPKVGVVIVRNGETLVSAHRNENGKGSHAEYLAFKKAKEGYIDVRGAILYTTLEPCTHRKDPRHGRQRIPCAEYIIKEGIDCVVIGMLDPNPKIKQVGFCTIQNSGIKIVSGTLEDEIKVLNREFIKKYAV